jgi:hypothetical protein
VVDCLPSMHPHFVRVISLFYFHTHIQSTSTIFTLLHPLNLSPSHIHTGTHLWTGPVSPSCPSFFKCVLTVQGGFTLVFHTYVHHSFNQINPLFYLLFLYHPAPLLFNTLSALCYTIFINRSNVFQYYSLFVVIFSSPASP